MKKLLVILVALCGILCANSVSQACLNDGCDIVQSGYYYKSNNGMVGSMPPDFDGADLLTIEFVYNPYTSISGQGSIIAAALLADGALDACEACSESACSYDLYSVYQGSAGVITVRAQFALGDFETATMEIAYLTAFIQDYTPFLATCYWFIYDGNDCPTSCLWDDGISSCTPVSYE